MSELDPELLAHGILRASPDMCYALDRDGRLVWWNDSVRERTGYDDESLDEMDVFELIAPEQRGDARAAFEHTESLPPQVSLSFEFITKDGERIPHEFNGTQIEVDGRVIIAGIGRDITDRRERERALRRRQDELDTLNRINETIYEVIQAVIDAATREGIEEVTCRRLADSGLYQAVWMGRNSPGDEIELQAGRGESERFLEVVEELNEVDWRQLARTAIERESILVVQNVPELDLPSEAKEAADRLGIQSGIAVPIVHRDRVEGVLCVYSKRPDGFNERERAAFRRLGEVVGFAIRAVQTERLVLSDTATELTFRITDPDALLASLSERADGPCRHEWSTPTESGNYRHYVTVAGLAPEAVAEVAHAYPNVETLSHVGSDSDGQVYEVVTSDSLIRRLLDLGASPVSLVARDGESTVVAEVPGDSDTRPVVEAAADVYDAELVSKRTVDRPVRTADEFYDEVDRRLTDRQRSALKHAYFGGYFSWPRDATAEEIADRMSISSPTLHYHLRRAQEALVEEYIQHLE